ncbi:MAG: hypothetical protein ACXVCY_02870 [Pseudobdellovibrionaceae bacterium]
MKGITVFILAHLFFSVMARASECITETEASDLLSSYSIFTYDNSSEQWAEKKSIPFCDNEDTTNNLAKGLRFLHQVQTGFDAENGGSLSSRIAPETYFKNRISIFQIETEKTSELCNPGQLMVAAYVQQGQGPIMHVCTNAFKGQTPLVASEIMVHEARHIDGFSHVFCAQGWLASRDDKSGKRTGACDESFELQGSYGVETNYLLQVYQRVADPVVKQEARSLAVLALIERFNKLPLDLQSGALIQSAKGELSFFDGKTKQTVLDKSGKLQISTMREDVLTLFDRNGTVGLFYYSPKLAPVDDGVVKTYNKNLSVEERAEVLDIYYSNEFSCMLLKGFVSCATENDTFWFQFNSIEPVQFVKTHKSALLSDDSLYIAASDKHLYKLPKTAVEFRKVTSEEQLEKSQRFNIMSLAPGFGSDELGVSLDGKLYNYSPKQKNWTEVGPYKGEKNLKVISPYLWSKVLQNL